MPDALNTELEKPRPVATSELAATLTRWLRDRGLVPNPEIVELRPLVGGLSNETWFLTVRHDSPDMPSPLELVLRWDRGEGIMAPYDMVRQFRVMQALGPTAVPVPRVLWLEPDVSVLGAQFYVVEYIKAETPGRLLDRNSSTFAPRMKSYIDTLAKIHAVDWRLHDLAFLVDDEPGDAADHAIHAADRFVALVESDAELALFSHARQWLEDHKPAVVDLSFVHVDCSVSNYMFSGNEVVAVVDWELSTISSALRDIGLYVTMLFKFRPESSLDEQLQEREEFLGMYQVATGADYEQLPFWEAAACFQMAAATSQPLHTHKAPGYSNRLAVLTDYRRP